MNKLIQTGDSSQLVSENGEVIFRAYDISTDGRYQLEENGKWGILDLGTGEIIRESFAYYIYGDGRYQLEENGKWGVLDLGTGEIIKDYIIHTITNQESKVQMNNMNNIEITIEKLYDDEFMVGVYNGSKELILDKKYYCINFSIAIRTANKLLEKYPNAEFELHCK